MSKEQFLELETKAEELVHVLDKLKNEISLYDTATQELGEVRERLIVFINHSQKITKDTHDVVQLLKAAGGPKILKSLTQIIHSLSNLKILVILTLVIALISVFMSVYSLIQ